MQYSRDWHDTVNHPYFNKEEVMISGDHILKMLLESPSQDVQILKSYFRNEKLGLALRFVTLLSDFIILNFLFFCFRDISIDFSC